MNHCKQTVFLILLMLVLLLPLASAEGARAFITVDDCVPLEIREGSSGHGGRAHHPEVGERHQSAVWRPDSPVAHQ